MLIQHAYIKPRSQFGKQCFFNETDPIVQENILPDPELIRDYIGMSHCHHGIQKSEQFAFHEMQTVSKITKESGMLHLEGGWPKEINMKDEEAVLRFRRRVEKDENWAPRMKRLTDPMESYILQNNAVDIYENYFDDMVPSALVLPHNIRISNVYADPQPIVRPVNHLSWSPGAQNRLAASYTFMEFETKQSDVNPYSYIWDIENPNTPVVCLRSLWPLMITEFNPRDPSILISGLMSGQVCNWDIRIGNGPVQMSHRQFSHRNPANQALWITSKTNTEFFSASTDGTIKWWDIRKLRRPTDELVMDLDDPLRADVVRAYGVTALQYEPTMGYKFLAGMENGLVINGKRKAASPIDKLAMTFNCHVGPVVAIDRNPFALKNFLTVGDWTVKIWAEDTRENSLITLCEQNVDLRGGCWSRSRYSVFFTINVTGLLEVYDILTGLETPVTRFRVCNECLTTIAPHENGRFLAIGSRDGNIYLTECFGGLIVNTKNDKANLIAYLESCSRFEKAVDIRLKEIRLMQANAPEDYATDYPVPKSRYKKGNNKERNKDKTHVKEKGEQFKKKSRLRKIGRDDAFFEDLAETEVAFFHAVEKEFASYSKLEDLEAERVASLIQEMSRKKKKVLREPLKAEDEVVAQEPQGQPEPVGRKRIKAVKSKSPVRSLMGEMEVDKEEEAVTKMEAPSVKSEKTAKGKRRGGKILSKVCTIEVCKPEICCADMEEKWGAKLQTKFTSKKESSRAITPRWRKLPDFEGKDESLTNVLADEVEEAKRELRAWQKSTASGKRDFWRPRTTEVAHERPEGKKEEIGYGDVESATRDVGKERLNFRQLAETGSKWKSGNGSEDKISQARKREAGQLNPHLEKCAQGEEMCPVLSAYTVESTETTTIPTATSSRGSN